MNIEEFEGKWEQLKGMVKSKWGKLTDNDMLVIRGEKQRLVGLVHERYGKEKKAAEEEVDAFIAECSARHARTTSKS